MTRLQAWQGDISDLEVDAIVSPATVSLWMSSGVGAAIKKRGGEGIEIAAVRQGPIAPGEAIVTPGGKLLATHVIHAATLEATHRATPAMVAEAARNAVRRAHDLGVRSIAFPALGAGGGGLDIETSAHATISGVRDGLAAAPGIRRVVFALPDMPTFIAFRDEIERTDEGETGEAGA